MNIDGSLLMGVAALITSMVNAWRDLRPMPGGRVRCHALGPARAARRSRMGQLCPGANGAPALAKSPAFKSQMWRVCSVRRSTEAMTRDSATLAASTKISQLRWPRPRPTIKPERERGKSIIGYREHSIAGETRPPMGYFEARERIGRQPCKT